MVFEEPASFTCEACGAKQPESKISTLKFQVIGSNGYPVEERIYYCTESKECTRKAVILLRSLRGKKGK